jgi:hypothetical protein
MLAMPRHEILLWEWLRTSHWIVVVARRIPCCTCVSAIGSERYTAVPTQHTRKSATVNEYFPRTCGVANTSTVASGPLLYQYVNRIGSIQTKPTQNNPEYALLCVVVNKHILDSCWQSELEAPGLDLLLEQLHTVQLCQFQVVSNNRGALL